ncbi:hypothetical protein NODU109028_08805 [Nocardioides dubius]|uniref:Transmembrane protein n=1 Tax=Nocardioides dubius TaxID=317019 RepID=A0ABN1TVB1_9ACTN
MEALAPLLVLALLLLGYVLGIGFWVVAGFKGLWRHWPWHLSGVVLLLPPTAILSFVGLFAGGLDTGETCAMAGQEVDWEYAVEHERVLPPFSSPCNADHDLVPTWHNVAVIGLLALVAVFTVMMVTLFVRQYVVRPLRRRAAA